MHIKEDQQVWSIYFFDSKIGLEARMTSKMEVNINEALVQESYKPVIKKFKRKSVCKI